MEALIATTLGGIVLAIATGSLLFLSKTAAGYGNYQHMNMTSRTALEAFASDARMTKDVNSATATAASFEVSNSAGSTDTVVYAFDEAAGTFTRRVNGGPVHALLEDVESLTLTYFNLKLLETTLPIEVKEVQLHAIMQRKVLRIGNTNEIISARFLMRNRAVSN